MKKVKKRVFQSLLVIALPLINSNLLAQNTKIRGFVEANTSLKNDQLNFGFGEQDLFITSELSDKFSFLGETVFKYNPSSSTEFSISIERVIIKYNFKGNHSLLIGKHHTAISYWNDTYHHGRVFFPTIDRPILFAAKIIPIHTTGLAVQGFNLGKLKFGYEIMIGNGIGSHEIKDDNKPKSITMAAHIKPFDNFQFGISFYNDVISAGAEGPVSILNEEVKQQLFTTSISYFGKKYEFLSEGTFASNKNTSVGRVNAFAGYIYAGLKVKEKWVPYVRFDNLSYQNDDFYFNNDDTNSYVAGLRYEINYLAVVKLEFEHEDRDIAGSINSLTFQIAVGF